MATTKFTLLEGVWTQVATADAIFQNIGNKVIHVTESATAPTDSSDFKLIEPLEIYEFNPTTGLNLYAKSIEGTSAVSVDGVGATLVEGEVTINSTTPVNVKAEDNFEDDITAVETWLELPENIKAVSFILDCSDNTEATLEYTFDRSASPSGVVESELGTLVNDKEGGYLAGAVAQVRMDDVVSNAVVAVPTVTKITFATAAPSTGDTIVFGNETYEFTTDSETGLTDPANIRIDMDALSITDETAAAQGFKTVFNDNTAYDVAASGDVAVITLTASANFEDYNDLATTTSITATATATYEGTTFGGGTGDSTTGVDAVAATLPKLWIIGIK